MSNIYCKDCQNFTDGEKIPFSQGPSEWNRAKQRCTAPENYKNTHKKSDDELIEKPWIINFYNDCIWFDPIVDSSSSSSSSGDQGTSSSSSSSSEGDI